VDIVDARVEDYMRSLLTRYDEPVLLEMEAEGKERGFPIIGRLVGVTVELLARSVGAMRVFELGYWFARAVGPSGEVHGTDGDPANEPKALDYLSRAGLAEPIRWHVGDAVTHLGAAPGEFDVVYNDIDKDGYPAAWMAARERIRVGGLYVCDNVLWSGRVAVQDRDDPRPVYTQAILEHNRMIAEDDRFISSIVPTRDGVFVALRVA
jgi:caffeoyl-CoA O-methyltransferase